MSHVKCYKCGSDDIITRKVQEQYLHDFLDGKEVPYPNPEDEVVKIMQCDSCKAIQNVTGTLRKPKRK